MAIFGVDWGTFWDEHNKLWDQNQKHWDKHGELERELGRIRHIVEGDDNEWGLVQHVHGTGQRGQEGLWAKLTEAQEKNRALEARLDSLQEKYEKLNKLLIEAARKQLGDK